MASILLNWFESAEQSFVASSIRQSTWLYPALEIVHIVGLVLVAGGAILFDLFLLGGRTNTSFSAFSSHLLSWSKAGLLLVIPSGILLFMTNATALAVDTTFHLKLILLVAAGINALVFHRFVVKKEAAAITVSAGASVTAICSIFLWIAIIACGRLLAY